MATWYSRLHLLEGWFIILKLRYRVIRSFTPLNTLPCFLNWLTKAVALNTTPVFSWALLRNANFEHVSRACRAALRASLFTVRIRDIFVCICTSAECECSPFRWPYQFRHRLLLATLPLKLYWIGPGCSADQLDNRMAIVAPSQCQIEHLRILFPSSAFGRTRHIYLCVHKYIPYMLYVCL